MGSKTTKFGSDSLPCLPCVPLSRGLLSRRNMLEAHDDPQSTVERPKVAPTTLGLPSVRLEVIAGPDAGTAFEMDPATPGRVYAGKSEACQLRLTDPLVS